MSSRTRVVAICVLGAEQPVPRSSVCRKLYCLNPVLLLYCTKMYKSGTLHTDPTNRIAVQVRRGNHTVHERHHTVVMGWNKQLMPVLQQVGCANIGQASH